MKRIFQYIVCSIQFSSKMWLMVACRLNGIIIHIKRWYHIKVETYKSWFSSKNTATGSILIYLHSLSANTAIWSHNVRHSKKILFLSIVHIDYKLGHWFFVFDATKLLSLQPRDSIEIWRLHRILIIKFAHKLEMHPTY